MIQVTKKRISISKELRSKIGFNVNSWGKKLEKHFDYNKIFDKNHFTQKVNIL